MKKSLNKVCILRLNNFPEESHLKRNVDALLEDGFLVDVICLKKNLEKYHEDYGNLNVYRIPMQRKRGRRLRYLFEYIYFCFCTFWVLSFLFFKKKYGFVEVDTMPDFLVFSAIIPKIFGSKIILYLFENMPELYLSEKKSTNKDITYRILKFIEEKAIRFSDNAISVHDHSMKLFLSPKIQASKFVIVLNVPDNKVFPNTQNINNYNNNSFTLVSHGSLLERYGYQVAIESIILLKDKIPNLKYLIYGEGEYKTNLKDLVERHYLTDVVFFKGYLKFNVLMNEIALADIGIIPIFSNYEMLPNKLFEYFELEIPIVISEYDILKKYFSNKEVVYFKEGDPIDLANKIYTLYTTPIIRKSLKDNMHFAKVKYNWTNIKKNYLEIFK